jgi:EamA domain-containing membrane protein RarD
MRLPLCQLFHGMDLFGERVSQSEYFSICVAAAHIMVHKYGSQGYKTFQNCLFMFGIHFRITIWDGL